MKRVAAYCRVSTDKEDQANSFESQKRYFRECIERNPDWELFNVYADEGISGTSTRGRDAFNRMIAEARAGSFDFIITKEVSRFARNTVDTLQYTRELKRLGIGVLFVNDHINTLEPDAELRLTIMSSIAQEESRKTSERVKWGQRRRMEQGVVFGHSLLGYNVHNGRLRIDEDGAAVVRSVFHKFLNEGKGSSVIARELEEAGIPAPSHTARWSHTAILRILRNEKYCGDLVQKKTFTPDYLSHKKKYNRGEETFVALWGHHEPIVSREVFDAAQSELARRSHASGQKARYSGRHAFSGKIECGLCGSRFVARVRKRRDGAAKRVWGCHEAVRHGTRKPSPGGECYGCDIHLQLKEEAILSMIHQILAFLGMEKDPAVTELIAVVNASLNMAEPARGCPTPGRQAGCPDSGPDASCPAGAGRPFHILAQKRARLLELYLEQAIEKSEYLQKAKELQQEQERLEYRLQGGRRHKDVPGEHIARISAFIHRLIACEAQDDPFYRHLAGQILVRDPEHIEIVLQKLPVKWEFRKETATSPGV